MSLSPADHRELTDLVTRLCHALDFSRPQDFADVFTSDGVYRAVSSTVTGEQQRFRHAGADELLAFATAAVRKRRGLGRHWTGNLLIEGDGDAATATSYVLFVEIDGETGERRIPISGVHRDTFRRTPEGWRFASRTVVADV
ncbi:MAG: nuclear transport factor 2 family protein [Microbacterium sp.]|uniref:nuclear transport factor 2 family protein n=1 Tax=Microbacterium sp. TaxID=51671 RepID=UPI0039E2FAEE